MAGAAVSTGGAAELAIGAAAAASSGSGGAAGQRQLQPTYGHQKDPQQQQKQLLQLEPTLRHMHGRAAFRQHYGAYNPARPGLSIVLTLLLLLGCLISAVYWTKTGPVVVLSMQAPQIIGGWGGFNIISSVLVLVVLLFLCHKVGRLESFALNLLTAAFAAMMMAVAIVLVVQQKEKDVYCGGRHEESTATTLQDFLVSLYLVLALGLVSTRGLVRWAAPKLAAAGSPLVSGRVVALEEVAAGDVEFAQGVFCPPDGYRPAGRVVAAVFEVVWPGWLAWAPPCVRRRLTAVCSYVGEVDEEGRPHGFGEWRSSTYHGEHLRGFWERGVPEGPFRSRETGSASSFVCLQFAITSNLGHWMTTCMPLPSAQVQPGLVAVEVSATGVFFHGLPRIREIEVAGRPWAPKRRVVGAPGCGGGGGGGASAPGAGCGCAARPAADDFGQENDVEAPPAAPTPIISTPIPVLTGGGAGASALIASLQQPVVLPMQPVLEAGVAPEECAGGPTAATNSARGGCDSYSAARGCSEVFLFVHGLGEDFGNGHVRMFGQMIALLELPPHIAPLLFCWPSGVVSCYHPARYLGAEDVRCHAALVAVLRQLAEQGIGRVHVATHSMGARVLLGAVPLLEAEAAGGAHLPSLASVTLLNPDYELATFVTDTGPRMRRLCRLVTIYGDPADQALLLAEVANGATNLLLGFGPTAAATRAAGRALKDAMARSAARRAGAALAQSEANELVAVGPRGPVAEGEEAAAEAAGAEAGADAGPSRERLRLQAAVAAFRRPPRGASASAGAGGAGGKFAAAAAAAAAAEGGGESADGGGGGGGYAWAWRAAAMAAAVVADGAARVSSSVASNPVVEWWVSRPSRAGSSRKVRARAAARGGGAAGGLAHGMWERKGGGGGGAAGAAAAEAAAAAAGGGDDEAAEIGPHLSLGRRIYGIEAPLGQPPLDVDVVDLTCLAVNVPAHRHSVHALNRDVLWDLHNIIVQELRAAKRTQRLERIAGNVYSFKTSPAHVHCDLL